MSFTRKVAYNTIAQLLGKFLCTLISIVLVIFLTRYLGASGYGQYNIAITFIGFFVVLADFGIYPIAVREMSQRSKEREKILGNVFTFRLISASIVLLLGFLIAFFMPYEQIVKWAIGIAALYSFFGLITGSLISVFQINYRMDLPALIELISRTLFLFLIILAIRLKFSLLGIFWLLALSSFLNFILIYLLGLRFIKLRPRLQPAFLKEFIKESWPMGVVAILSMIHFKVDTIILSLMKSSSDVGIYGVSYRVFENLIIIPSIFVSLIFPRLSELFVTDKEGLKRVFQKAVDVLILAVFPIVIFFFLLSPYTVQIIAGKEFLAASSPLCLLLLSLFGIFLAMPFHNLLIASGKQFQLIWVGSLAAFLNITLNLFLIQRFSYNGAALATFISETVVFFAVFWLAWYLIKIRPNFSLFFKTLFPSFLTFIAFSFLLKLKFFRFDYFLNLNIIKQLFLVLVAFLFGFLTYLALLFGFRVITKNSILEIFRR
jgi:O-antigen/teichoic acid export membrane protein